MVFSVAQNQPMKYPPTKTTLKNLQPYIQLVTIFCGMCPLHTHMILHMMILTHQHQQKRLPEVHHNLYTLIK